uniref:Uncharacterized protein n=1 Tax=Panagrolaimus sp. ES5 TaxID=591445 RepID=A0AC34EZX0_9BILA
MNYYFSKIFLFLLITVIHAAELPPIEFQEDDVDDQQQQQLLKDDTSNSDNHKDSSSSSSSSTVYIVLAVIFFILMLVSLGLMIFCIRKYRNKKKELMQNNSSKKGLDGKSGGTGFGGGQIKPLSVQPKSQHAQQQQKKLNGRVVPKEIKITGIRPGSTTSTSVKTNASVAATTTPSTLAAKKSQTTKSPSETTTTTTTKTAPKTKKMQRKKEAEKDNNGGHLNVEPTQQSSHLERIPEDEELEVQLSRGKMIQKTFICFDGKDWHEPQTAETDDFSFEIESGNTFSMLSN